MSIFGVHTEFLEFLAGRWMIVTVVRVDLKSSVLKYTT